MRIFLENHFMIVSGIITLILGIVFFIFNDYISNLLVKFRDNLIKKGEFEGITPVSVTSNLIKFIGFMWIVISFIFFFIAYSRG